MTGGQVSVALFGAGGAGKSLLSELRPHVRVAAVLDNDPAKAGSLLGGVPVRLPVSLDKLGVDRILICSTHQEAIEAQLTGELRVPPERILNVHRLLYDFRCRMRMEAFEARRAETRCLVTGISYAMLGVLESRMPVPTLNLANAGQDLYYDAKICDRVLDRPGPGGVRHVLLGLTRYSYHYDMSLRRDPDGMAGYGNFFGDFHHAASTRAKVGELLGLLGENYFEKLYRAQRAVHETYFARIDAGDFSNFHLHHRDMLAKGEIAAREHAKHHPATFRENTRLLRGLLDRLKGAGLRPVLFSVPGPEAYRSAIPKRLDEEFVRETRDISREKGVPFWDMLAAPQFGPEHFYDGAHLDAAGAALFTRLLGERLLALPDRP